MKTNIEAEPEKDSTTNSKAVDITDESIDTSIKNNVSKNNTSPLQRLAPALMVSVSILLSGAIISASIYAEQNNTTAQVKHFYYPLPPAGPYQSNFQLPPYPTPVNGANAIPPQSLASQHSRREMNNRANGANPYWRQPGWPGVNWNRPIRNNAYGNNPFMNNPNWNNPYWNQSGASQNNNRYPSENEKLSESQQQDKPTDDQKALQDKPIANRESPNYRPYGNHTFNQAQRQWPRPMPPWVNNNSNSNKNNQASITWARPTPPWQQAPNR